MICISSILSLIFILSIPAARAQAPTNSNADAPRVIKMDVDWYQSHVEKFNLNGKLSVPEKLLWQINGVTDSSGFFQSVHFHQIDVVRLNIRGRGEWRLRASGFATVLRQSNEQGMINSTHIEPTNARIDVTFPLRKRTSILFGMEAGSSVDQFGGNYEITPGARATVRLRF